MRLGLYLMTFFLLLPLFAAADSQPILLSHPFFYKVTLNGQTSYLLGTIHFGVDLAELPAAVEQKLESSRLLMTEVVGSESEIHNWLYDYVTAILNESKKYPRRGVALSEDEKQLLLDKWKIPQSLVEIITSGSCGLFATLSLPTVHQMDLQIQLRAYELGLPMLAMDNVALRKAAEVATGECDIRNALRTRTRKDYLKSLADLQNDYRAGSEIRFVDFSEGVRLRNNAWLKSLLIEIGKGNVFVDVGVGHLFGPSGLVPLIRRAGGKVERIEAVEQ